MKKAPYFKLNIPKIPHIIPKKKPSKRQIEAFSFPPLIKMGYKEPDDQIEGHKSEIFIFSGNIMKELEINEANNMFLTCFPYSTKRKKLKQSAFFVYFCNIPLLLCLA